MPLRVRYMAVEEVRQVMSGLRGWRCVDMVLALDMAMLRFEQQGRTTSLHVQRRWRMELGGRAMLKWNDTGRVYAGRGVGGHGTAALGRFRAVRAALAAGNFSVTHIEVRTGRLVIGMGDQAKLVAWTARGVRPRGEQWRLMDHEPGVNLVAEGLRFVEETSEKTAETGLLAGRSGSRGMRGQLRGE
jgi:hypothetical protein